jgi:C4-dicarboxylate transporter
MKFESGDTPIYAFDETVPKTAPAQHSNRQHA